MKDYKSKFVMDDESDRWVYSYHGAVAGASRAESIATCYGVHAETAVDMSTKFCQTAFL